MGWIKIITCEIATSNSVATAYGTAMFPGSVTNGAQSEIVTYDNATGATDPNAAGWTVSNKVTTVVVNGDTDILNKVVHPTRNHPAGVTTTMVLASADQVAGQFPGPMDQNTANPDAWVVGSTLGPGTLNTTTLTSNNVPPLNMSAIGFPSTWLLRLENTTTGDTAVNVCPGNASPPCPCGNHIAGTVGGCACAYPGGPSAGLLDSSGSRNATEQGTNPLRFSATGINTNPGLFFQGSTTLNNGIGLPFGDGIRCCGGTTTRIEIADPPSAGGGPGSTTSTAAFPPSAPGTKVCYQYWYRCPGARSICGNAFNLTNGVSHIWGP
jgi:hypothetical protein